MDKSGEGVGLEPPPWKITSDYIGFRRNITGKDPHPLEKQIGPLVPTVKRLT